MFWIIDDDKIMAECIARAIKKKRPKSNIKIFSNAITATAELNQHTPELIFLDILLDGPNGFTFLHELASYSDTAKIPIVLVTSLNLKSKDLSDYGVVGILHKDTMTPADITKFIEDTDEKH